MSKRVTVTLDDELYEALATAAEDAGRPFADVLRDTVREAVLGEGRKEGVGELAERLIRDGLPNEEVLSRVRDEFPDARTSDASIRWYRTRLRKNGEDVPTQVEARRQWAERDGAA